MNDQRVMLTEAELGAFTQKLALWAGSLSGNEQAFLQQMLADAADAANEDVSGYVDLSSLDQEDDVQGFGIFPGASGALIGSISGYAQGLAREDAETVGAFDAD